MGSPFTSSTNSGREIKPPASVPRPTGDDTTSLSDVNLPTGPRVIGRRGFRANLPGWLNNSIDNIGSAIQGLLSPHDKYAAYREDPLVIAATRLNGGELTENGTKYRALKFGLLHGNVTEDLAVKKAVELILKAGDDYKLALAVASAAFSGTIFDTNGKQEILAIFDKDPQTNEQIRNIMLNISRQRFRIEWMSSKRMGRQVEESLDQLERSKATTQKKGVDYISGDGRAHKGANLEAAEDLAYSRGKVRGYWEDFQAEYERNNAQFAERLRASHEQFFNMLREVNILPEAEQAFVAEVRLDLPNWVRAKLSDRFNGSSTVSAALVGTDEAIQQQFADFKRDLREELNSIGAEFAKKFDDDPKALVLERLPFFAQLSDEQRTALANESDFKNGWALARTVEEATQVQRLIKEKTGSSEVWFSYERISSVHKALKERLSENEEKLQKLQDESKRKSKITGDIEETSTEQEASVEQATLLSKIEEDKLALACASRHLEARKGCRTSYRILAEVNRRQELERGDFEFAVNIDPDIEDMPPLQRVLCSETVYPSYDLRDLETKIALGLVCDPKAFELDPNLEYQPTPERADELREQQRLERFKNPRDESDWLVMNYYEANRHGIESHNSSYPVMVAELKGVQGGSEAGSGERVKVVTARDFLAAREKFDQLASQERLVARYQEIGNIEGLQTAENALVQCQNDCKKSLTELFGEGALPEGRKIRPEMLAAKGQKEVSSSVMNLTKESSERSKAEQLLASFNGKLNFLGGFNKMWGHLDKFEDAIIASGTSDWRSRPVAVGD